MDEKTYTGLEVAAWHWTVRLQCRDRVGEWLTEGFEGFLKRERTHEGEAIIGTLADEAAVYGFLLQLRDRSVHWSRLAIVRSCFGSAQQDGRRLTEG